MLKYISTPRGLATCTGAGILAAATNTNVMSTGGYWTSHAALVIALSAGVFAGARVIGAGAAGRIAAVIICALAAGELYNFSATGERIVVEREGNAAPLRAQREAHDAAVRRASEVSGAPARSARLDRAVEAQSKARAAYEKELREGGRCKTICNGLKEDAARAAAEVTSAAQEAQQLHAAAIEAAKAEVAANPLPASATPFADRIGWAPWALDLFIAGLLSLGANGLAAALIGYGAARDAPACVGVRRDAEQSDVAPDQSDNIIRIYRPDQDGTGGSGFGPSPKPRPAGPTGLSKEQALSDILQRLTAGETIPSQDSLASDWGRSKQTVSDWMREWRRIGVVPAPVRIGKFKMTVAG
jgi:hypothetical protein